MDNALTNEDPRADLAASFRWFDRLGMSEAIANHFSYVVEPGGTKFLMNPYGVHWSVLRASDLLELDMRRLSPELADKVDPTGWSIHGAIHRLHPGARCIMHLHSRYATALSALEDPTLPPIDQTTMRFFNRVAIDTGFDGMGLAEEGERLAMALGQKKVLMMGQHGILVVAESIAEAFDLMYHFERGCETYLIALASGLPLRIAAADVAEKTASQWEHYPGFAAKHLAAARQVLEGEQSDYAC